MPEGQDITGWHVYSMDWTATGFVFKVDDREIYQVTRAMVEQYGRWAYDNPKFLILNVAIGGNYPQAVNHAQMPYPAFRPGRSISSKPAARRWSWTGCG